MPLYVYKCQTEGCDKEVTEVREVDERDDLPTEPCSECKHTNWKRIMCAAVFKRLYSGRKGYW